ncbi:MAG TPA: hypothetical protein VEH82_03715 [Acidimicrobiales bacterium]|nr:hypothetical protein [Acidimicrobiales bacterium]
MLLTPPRPLLRAESPGTCPAGPADEGTGRELLALLRGTTAARPRFDPGLAGGLRAWLEDAAYDVVARRGEDAPPLVLGPRRLLDADEEGPRRATSRHQPASEEPADTEAEPGLEARLVHALFRQLVHTGAVADPLTDALDALRASGGGASAHAVAALPVAGREALAASLARQVANLRMVVPRFVPGWMPRTDDHVAIPLAGGRVVLQGTFDLLVGLPRPGRASLCALGLSTGGPWPRERRTLHFLALLETLRSGTPPFRLALIESSTRRYGVEDVREEHLRALASHLVAWLAAEGRSHTGGAARA